MSAADLADIPFAPEEKDAAPAQVALPSDIPLADTRLQDSFEAASQIDPDHAGKVLALSRKTGLEPGYVSENLDAVKKAADAPAPQDLQQIQADHPKTAAFLSNPVNMAATHDDIGSLTLHERLVNGFSDAYDGLKADLATGLLQAHKAMLHAGTILGQDNAARIADIDRQVEAYNSPRFGESDTPQPGLLRRSLKGAIEMAPQMLEAHAAGASGALAGAGIAAATFPPAAPLAAELGYAGGEGVYWGAQIAGQAKEELSKLRDANGQPISPAIQNTVAVAIGIAGAAPSVIAANNVLSSTPAGRAIMNTITQKVGAAVLKTDGWREALMTFAKGTLEQAGVMGGTLAALTGVQGEGVKLAKNMSGQPFAPENPWALPKAMLESGVSGAGTGVLIGLPGLTTGLGMDAARIARDKGLAQASREFVQALHEASVNSKLHARDEQGYQDHLNDLAAGTPVSNVLVPAESFERYFQSKNIDPQRAAAELGVSDSYDEANQTGGHVEIPLGTFQGKDMDAHRPGLVNDVTFDREVLTPNQTSERQAAVAGQMREQVAAADEAVKTDAKARAGYDAVYQDIKGKLEAQRRPPEEAKQFFAIGDQEWESMSPRDRQAEMDRYVDMTAKLWAQRATTTAARRGVSAEDYYKGAAPEVFNAERAAEYEAGPATFAARYGEKEAQRMRDFVSRSAVDRFKEKVSAGIDTLKERLFQGEYRGSHKAPGPDFGAPLNDLTGGGTMYPDDVYGPNAARYYGHGDDALDNETVRIAQSYRGKPDADVVIYRAVPKDVKAEINSGDWVTINRNYAKQHGESNLNGEYSIASKKVKARDVFTNADSIHEYGYHPSTEKLRQGERGYFDPQARVIALMRNADASTFLHESAHAWLADEFNYIRSGKASPEYMKDWKVVADWLGVQDGAERLTVDQHEKFAQGFEAYLREGRAPSKELRRPFASFRRWLTNIYRDVTKSLGVDLSPEVRGVMDRMLASDQEITEAEHGLYHVSEQQMAGMDPEEASWLRAAQADAHEEAVSSLLKDQMGETTAKRVQFLAEERARVEKKAAEETAKAPVYAAADAMRLWFGENHDAREVATDYLGEKLDDARRTKFDDIAEDHGFTNGHEMAQALLAAPARDEAVRRQVDAYMAQYADLKDTERIKEEAAKAVRSGKQLELMHLEGAALEGAGRKVKVTDAVRAQRRAEAKAAAAIARQKAREILAGKPVEQASSYRSYIAAERNAAVKAAEAAMKGDFEAARKYKEQQMLNHALASEAMKNRLEAQRVDKFLNKFATKPQDLKDMPYGYVRKIYDLLEHGGIKDASPEDLETQGKIAAQMAEKGKTPEDIANATGMVQTNAGWSKESLPQFVERVQDGYHVMNLPPKIAAMDFGELGKNLTMADLRDLKMAVQVINEVGRGENRFLSFDAKLGIREAAEELRGRIESRIGTPYADKLAPGHQFDAAWKDRAAAIANLPDAMVPSMVNIRTLCYYLDGGPEGPAHDYIFNPLERAGNWKLERRAKMMEDVRAIFDKFYKPEDLEKYKTERSYTFNGRKWTKEEILSMRLNWGNAGNQDRIMKGFGLDRTQAEMMMDVLDKRDHDFAQAIHDNLETYWPEIKAQEMAVNGYEPGKVASLPVKTRYGTYRGGYFPIAYDFERSSDAYRTEEQKNALWKMHSAAAAHTEHGFTQGRVDSLKRPIRLNADVLFNHLENVVHDLAYRKAVIDVQRMLRQGDTKSAITGALGIGGMDTFDKTLKAIASDQGEFLSGYEKAFRWFRFGGTFATLGFRATTFPLRLAGDFSNAAWEIGPTRLAGAMKDYYMDPSVTKEFVDGKSPLMRGRAETRERDLMELAKNLEGNGAGWRKHAFMVDTLADQVVAYPMWNEVYKNALSEKGEAEAVRIADDAIARSFGSGTILDQVGAQRGSELKKLTSMYYSWTSMMFNRAWLDGKIAGLEYRADNKGKAAAIVAKTAFYSWLFPAVYENLVREAFRNSQTPSDDERNRRILGRALELPFGYMIGARDIAAAGISYAMGDRGAGFHMTPMEDALDSVIKSVGGTVHTAFDAQKHFDERWTEDMARSTAVLLKYPQQLNTWMFNFYDWMQDKGEATWRDALTRRTRK